MPLYSENRFHRTSEFFLSKKIREYTDAFQDEWAVLKKIVFNKSFIFSTRKFQVL